MIHFLSFEGTTRNALYKFFADSSLEEITGDKIGDRVVGRSKVQLTNEQLRKLDEITSAWREWKYIIEK